VLCPNSKLTSGKYATTPEIERGLSVDFVSQYPERPTYRRKLKIDGQTENRSVKEVYLIVNRSNKVI
jgi:hypothetical protein